MYLHDTAGVGAPGRRIEAHAQGARGEHVRGHVALAVHGGVAGDGDHGRGRLLAGAGLAVAGGVGVVTLGLEAAGLGHVLVGHLGPSAAATFVLLYIYLYMKKYIYIIYYYFIINNTHIII